MTYLVAVLAFAMGIALGRFIERRRIKSQQQCIDAHVSNMTAWADSFVVLGAPTRRG